MPLPNVCIHITLTDWNWCVYLKKKVWHLRRRSEETQVKAGEEEEEAQQYQSWDRWDVTGCHSSQNLLISMTQLSQPYFRKIKQPYGKLGCLGWGEGQEERSVCVRVCVCVKMNKLVVCRWTFCFSPPPICYPPSSTILSFWHGNGSKLMKTLHSFSDNSTGKRHKHFLHASSSITHETPPFCLLGIGWAGSCLIS